MGVVINVSLKYYEATFSNASKSDKLKNSWMRLVNAQNQYAKKN